MKKRIFIAILTLATIFVMNSCEDWTFLDEHPKKVDASTFMTNSEEVESVVNSMFYQLRREPGFGRYLSVLSESLSDYCYGRGNYNTSYQTGLTTGAIGFTADTWAVLYRTIRYGNELLSNLKDAKLNEKDRARYEGEVRFLRAFAYSYLIKYYGAVPFLDETNYGELYSERIPVETIWNFIVAECEFASKNLPVQPSQMGRPSKYAAMTLKAEAQLYLNDFAGAATSLGEIVSSGKYSLVEIDSADEFDNLYGYNTNGTPEEIFYIKYNRDAGATFPWMYFCKPNPVFNTGALGIYTDYVNNNVISSWDNNDFRYQWSLYKQTQNGTLNALTSTGMICMKYRDYGTNGSIMANDWPVYRYADVLLYNAEAICKRDGTPGEEAMEMVNMIRRRAYGHDSKTPWGGDYKLADYNNVNSFMGLVLKERGYETCFEGKRYCDLKRVGKLAEYAVKAGKISSESEVGDAAYWWPIPTDEFHYNEKLDRTKDQNPGY